MRASHIVPFAAIVALACEVEEASIGFSPEDPDGTGGEDADRGGSAGAGAADGDAGEAAGGTVTGAGGSLAGAGGGTSGGAAGAGGATPAPGSLRFEEMGWRHELTDDCRGSRPRVMNMEVHGTSPTNVVVTGFSGCSTPTTIFVDHLVGDAFQPLVEGVAGRLWAASPSLVFVSWDGGPSEDIVRIEDGQISREPLPIPARVHFWGSSATDILAVGGEGLIFRRDVQQWSLEESGTQAHLSSVWGSGSEAFAVGAGGTVLHRVAGVWSSMESGTEADLVDVWGTGPEDVYAVGGSMDAPGHVILHYDGVRWSIVNTGDARKSFLRGVSGASPSNVYVVGNYYDLATDDVPAEIHHWDGQAWVEISTQFATSDTSFSDIWCAQEDDCWIVGLDDALYHMTRSP